MTSRSLPLNLSVYSLAHALVDAICATVLTSLALFGELATERAVLLYLLYNFLAFAMQAPLGLLLDETRSPRAAAQLGLALQVAALAASPFSPEGAVFLAGSGNALFHLGGGVIALNLTPGRATVPGIFVAPGAVGLFLGIRLGMSAPLSFAVGVPLAGAALVLAFVMRFLPLPERFSRAPAKAPERPSLAWPLFCAVMLIFFSIGVRSYVGLSLSFPWKSGGFVYGFALAFAAGGGKALGGWLSDRLGFTRTCIGALLLSVPLLQWGGVSIAAGLAGCLCFQMTMAVTLLAYVRAYPGREAWAFGLACLALFAGSLPLLLPLPQFLVLADLLSAPSARIALTLLSILCLWRGLKVLGVERSAA